MPRRLALSWDDLITPEMMKSDDGIICLQLLGETKVNQLLTAELTLLNPLPELLQDCSFTIEGVGLTDGKPVMHKYARLFPHLLRILVDNGTSRPAYVSCRITDVGPRQEAKASIQFRPSRAGDAVLLVNFDSDKLNNIKSSINVDVRE